MKSCFPLIKSKASLSEYFPCPDPCVSWCLAGCKGPLWHSNPESRFYSASLCLQPVWASLLLCAPWVKFISSPCCTFSLFTWTVRSVSTLYSNAVTHLKCVTYISKKLAQIGPFFLSLCGTLCSPELQILQLHHCHHWHPLNVNKCADLVMKQFAWSGLGFSCFWVVSMWTDSVS